MKNISLTFILAIAIVACNTTANKDAAILKAKQYTIDSLHAVQAADLAKQHVIDSMQQVAATNEMQLVSQEKSATTVSSSGETVKKKKGMSATATGAIIGAGTGAITGAIVSKKKGEGAIVGGLIGAAAGAGTGAIIDANKKKRAKQ